MGQAGVTLPTGTENPYSSWSIHSSLEDPVLVKLTAKTLVAIFFKIRKKKNSILLMLINNAARLDLVISDPWRVIHLHFLPLPSSFPALQISDLPTVATQLPAPCHDPSLVTLSFTGISSNLPPASCHLLKFHSLSKAHLKGLFFISVLPCPQDYTCREEEKCLVLFMSDLYHNHDSIAYWVIRVSQCRPGIPGG